MVGLYETVTSFHFVIPEKFPWEFEASLRLDKVDPAKKHERRLEREKRNEKASSDKEKVSATGSLPAETTQANPRCISPALHDEVLARAGYRCEYISSKGVRCERRTYLHIDHRRPLAFGGKTSKKNLHNAQTTIWIRRGVSSDKTKSYSSLKLLNSSEQVLLPGGSFSPRLLGRGD